MAIVTTPPNAEPIGGATLSPPWINWFFQVYRSARMDYGSGTTAQRPVNDLVAGGRYFDTSLGANGKPIWINKTAAGWVLADGTAA